MTLADVNVFINAHRPEAARHEECRAWLDGTIKSDQAYGYSELVLGSFVRIVTNPRIYKTPTPLVVALAAVAQIRSPSHAVVVSPGVRHWEIFERLCRSRDVMGDLVSDAYLAALAIEWGCDWITLDGDYALFTDLKQRRPF